MCADRCAHPSERRNGIEELGARRVMWFELSSNGGAPRESRIGRHHDSGRIITQGRQDARDRGTYQEHNSKFMTWGP